MPVETKFDRAMDYAIEGLAGWKYKNNITRIFLYGSCARNRAGAESDIDLYIELDTAVPPAALRELKTRCNSDDWTLPDVDVKIGMTGLLEKDDLFYQNIRKEGILLWERK